MGGLPVTFCIDSSDELEQISMGRHPVTLRIDSYILCLTPPVGLHVADHRCPIINEPMTGALFGLDLLSLKRTYVFYEKHIDGKISSYLMLR
jgi:hypothetical protein